MYRRDFLKLLAISGLGGMRLFAEDNISDYKAIVVLYLSGGNDGLNSFPPIIDDPKRGFENYYNIRNNIRINKNELPLADASQELDLSISNPYSMDNSLSKAYTKGFYTVEGWDLGFNALMPELAHLAKRGKVALFANMGNLIMPSTKEELQKRIKPTPPFLFAHNHQTKLALNGEASLLNYSGWGGRVADTISNSNSVYTTTVTIGNPTHLFETRQNSALVVSSSGPQSYYDISSDKRLAYDTIISSPKQNIFTALYAKKRAHSFLVQDVITQDWGEDEQWSVIWESKKNAYGTELFSVPNDKLLEQSSPATVDSSILKKLKATAKLLKISKDKGVNRQIFFVSDGGYDTHSNQSIQHARKLRALSMGLSDFYKALEAMNMERDVLLISISEFGRSTGNNDDGTDHAWGGNYFAMGGDINGGVYGTLPDLTLGSEDDLGQKGRLIPTTSFTQYYATACRWFGINESSLYLIFPELKNFDSWDLKFC